MKTFFIGLLGGVVGALIVGAIGGWFPSMRSSSTTESLPVHTQQGDKSFKTQTVIVSEGSSETLGNEQMINDDEHSIMNTVGGGEEQMGGNFECMINPITKTRINDNVNLSTSIEHKFNASGKKYTGSVKCELQKLVGNKWGRAPSSINITYLGKTSNTLTYNNMPYGIYKIVCISDDGIEPPTMKCESNIVNHNPTYCDSHEGASLVQKTAQLNAPYQKTSWFNTSWKGFANIEITIDCNNGILKQPTSPFIFKTHPSSQEVICQFKKSNGETYTCSTLIQTKADICGDGIKSGGEQCGDGDNTCGVGYSCNNCKCIKNDYNPTYTVDPDPAVQFKP